MSFGQQGRPVHDLSQERTATTVGDGGGGRGKDRRPSMMQLSVQKSSKVNEEEGQSIEQSSLLTLGEVGVGVTTRGEISQQAPRY